jgi:hypothetical protein
MEARFFNEGQLPDLDEDDVEENRDADNVELQGVDIASWEKKDEL